MHILIVEDDRTMADYVSDGLRRSGFVCTHAADGEEGLVAVLHGGYDAVVMDIMLPKLDGLEIIRRARAAGVRTPIIVLSARGSVEAKVTGLEAGGDDYLAKPFSITELVARVQALLRRASATPEATALREADLEVDVVTHRVTRAERRIDLSLDTLPEGVRLVVADTGCGISAADLPHIYTRFWRADASRSLPGNGLGLALVKAIVTSYGGRLHCDSVPGQGSAFTVVLPTDG